LVVKIKIILLLLLLHTACTPEYVPSLDASSEQSDIISATGDPDGRVGELEATFLSSKSRFTFSESSLSSDTFSVSYVSTAQNFDVFKWIFEGGYTSSGSSTTSSGTTIVEGNINDPTTSSQIGVLVEYREGFGRYDVTHAVANSGSFDINTKSDYVTYEYLDDLKVQNSSNPSGWSNTSGLWYSPSNLSTITFSACENSIVGFYDNDDFTLTEPIEISKEFSNFGTSKKNLVFEYKIDFIVPPLISNNLKRISLGYTPNLSLTSSITVEDGELWFNSSNESTEFRQVVIPLPLISDFSLKFTKYPSVVNSMGRQAYPFNLCIRNIKIVPSD
tara:strand:- start:497 stop:1492 length:996 start_codon:yes stop_codon:yes gene_type:complete